MTAAEVAGSGEDGANDEDAFDGAVDDSEGKRLGMVLVPCLHVESEEGC